MIALRSILFNAAFYINLIVRMIILSPYYFMAERKAGLERTEKLGSIQSLAAGKDCWHDVRDRRPREHPRRRLHFRAQAPIFWDAYGLAAVA
jgi:hypothetical protein